MSSTFGWDAGMLDYTAQTPTLSVPASFASISQIGDMPISG